MVTTEKWSAPGSTAQTSPQVRPATLQKRWPLLIWATLAEAGPTPDAPISEDRTHGSSWRASASG